MTKLIQKIKSFAAADAGAALVEYGLILGVVTAVAAGALTTIGSTTSTNISDACSNIATSGCTD